MRTRDNIDAQIKALIWAYLCHEAANATKAGLGNLKPALPIEGTAERDFLDGAVNMAVDILFLGERIAAALETIATPATVAAAKPNENKRDIIGMKA